MSNQKLIVYDMIPVLVSVQSQSDKWAPAEIRSGLYFASTREVMMGEEALYLDSGEMYKVFGSAYPLGASNGREISEYLRYGAIIKLDPGRKITRCIERQQGQSQVFVSCKTVEPEDLLFMDADYQKALEHVKS